MSGGDMAMSEVELRAAIANNPFWYHTMELAPGVVTPGYWDVRRIVDRLPWPDVRGKRCLDVATADGFFAFELERRGAAEVVAFDVPDTSKWDWPPEFRELGPERTQEFRSTGNPGLRIAREALGSSVECRDMTAYELNPDTVGTFDVVVCGSVLVYLRDPLKALEAIRSVCNGHLLSMEPIRLLSTLLHPRRPLVELDGAGAGCRCWQPNAAAHRRMLFAAGFEIQRATPPYLLRLGERHRVGTPRHKRIARRLFGGTWEVPHAAVLARPRL
jgi:tRNA (mo5U34)-methyltransferase